LMRETIEFPRRQTAGLHHLVVGDALVTAVNDGTFQASFDLIVGIDHSECERLETAAFRPIPPKMTMNAFLVQIGGRRMLVDTGCGVSMGPTLGMLTDNLQSMGVEPEDIDTVLMTHLHPDHVNGLVDEHGQAAFPKAELVVNEADLNFFRDPDSPGRSPPETLEFFEGARIAVAPYADRIRSIRDGPVFPGVTAVTQAGHTPGQTAWLIESGSDALMIWGDVVHMPSLQMAAPQAGTVLDIDREQAIATRKRALDMAATDRIRVAGTHFDFPAIGHIERRTTGFGFVPEVWRAFV
jgi:glyoxylase-like metal-dependent hydrolase (beta-lactamase superfamily II)